MQTRHGWTINPDHVLTAGGLGSALAILFDALTEPGEPIMIFSPVYHEFSAKMRRMGRVPLEVPLGLENGRQVLDLERAQDMLTPQTKMMVFCSPNNPGGRVWTIAELQSVADFAEKNDLLLISDEIHHDLVYPGHVFRPMGHCTAVADRLITLTAPSKTFNIAGLRCGQIIIENDTLRDRISKHLLALQVHPNMAGVEATIAVYGPEGANYVDQLIPYLDENRRLFDAGINALPGVSSMHLEGTFLSWVDFSATGMEQEEITDRIHNRARIIPSPGPSFGPGGEGHMRFNIATQRAHVKEAVARLQAAFSDLQ
ncbi:MAG: aminotransferase class I/II-fold pyridoxal phosphate-dependent enzyme, partial [Pseudomonadota bacterium]